MWGALRCVTKLLYLAILETPLSLIAGVAQWSERWLAKSKVGGSTPLSRSKSDSRIDWSIAPAFQAGQIMSHRGFESHLSLKIFGSYNNISYLCIKYKIHMRNLVISPSITDKSSPSLQKYLSEVSSIKLLTPEEEYEIAVKSFDGDEKAREKLVKHNLRFVISVAKQYQHYGAKLEDLINEGNIGLIKSSNDFDPSRGFKFISYAVWQIRANIIKHIQDNTKTIRLPVSKSVKNSRIKKKYNLLEQQLERLPSYSELVEKVDGEFTEEEIEFFINSLDNKTKSLDSPFISDDSNGNLLDVLIDKNQVKPNFIVNSDDSKVRLDILLSRLTNFEKDVLILSYGLNGDEVLTLKEISEILGVAVGRVSITREIALRKLKYKLLKEGRWLKQIAGDA